MKQKTIVYVDGFNLYYGCLRKTPYKWLDLKNLLINLLNDNHEIIQIKYFTAHLSSRFGKSSASLYRQKLYLQAISSFIPELSIYYGHYLTHQIKAKCVYPPPEFTAVYKTEEKGTDVNIAIEILNDSWKNNCECVVLISNDSDLAGVLKMVKEQHGRNVGLIFPNTDKKDSPLLF
jgi:uncharacterized LabA/DUF88 family protein